MVDLIIDKIIVEDLFGEVVYYFLVLYISFL